MDDFHALVARTALAVLGKYGFALAGGYAVQAYGIIDRPSEDVDLFTDEPDPGRFEKAMGEAAAAWQAEGLTVRLDVHSGTFARFYVSNGSREMKAELSHDWRSAPPVVLDVGPVLSRDNSVGNKVTALFSRGEARDYIDVHGARKSGYSRIELEQLGAQHDGGFDLARFAAQLRDCARYSDADYTAYELSSRTVAELRAEFAEWANEIENR